MESHTPYATLKEFFYKSKKEIIYENLGDRHLLLNGDIVIQPYGLYFESQRNPSVHSPSMDDLNLLVKELSFFELMRLKLYLKREYKRLQNINKTKQENKKKIKRKES